MDDPRPDNLISRSRRPRKAAARHGNEAQEQKARTRRFSPKVICDLDPNPPVSEAEVRLVAAMLGGVIDEILSPDRTD
jgi:hypothetical protein